NKDKLLKNKSALNKLSADFLISRYRKHPLLIDIADA
ncbi:MAG: hypothetical protein ACI945_001856, partial [Pseudohongiellaceae bacterium]